MTREQKIARARQHYEMVLWQADKERRRTVRRCVERASTVQGLKTRLAYENLLRIEVEANDD